MGAIKAVGLTVAVSSKSLMLPFLSWIVPVGRLYLFTLEMRQ